MQIRLISQLRILLTFITTILINIVSLEAQQNAGPAPNHLVLPSGSFVLPFQWQGDSINSTWEPHTAMLIPVKLKNCPRQFFMQFDLGSPYSLFYTNKLAAIQSVYPRAIPGNLTTGKLLEFSFKAAKTTIFASEIVVKQFDSSTINWKDKKGIEIIGTIGADLIDGKVVIIDYPKNKLTISLEIPSAMASQLSLSDFIYTGRRVILPAKVQGRATMLYFDTGSSMFELLTDKKTSQSLAIPNTEPVVNKVNSWGKTLTAVSLASSDSVQVAGFKIPLHYSTYMEGVSDSQVSQMMKMGIGGMTGNKLLLNYRLVLDTKNKKFAVYQ